MSTKKKIKATCCRTPLGNSRKDHTKVQRLANRQLLFFFQGGGQKEVRKISFLVLKHLWDNLPCSLLWPKWTGWKHLENHWQNSEKSLYCQESCLWLTCVGMKGGQGSWCQVKKNSVLVAATRIASYAKSFSQKVGGFCLSITGNFFKEKMCKLSFHFGSQCYYLKPLFSKQHNLFNWFLPCSLLIVMVCVRVCAQSYLTLLQPHGL